MLWFPSCGKHLKKSGGRNFLDTEVGNKMWFQYCMNSPNSSLYLRAIQGYTDGNLMPRELSGEVAIPYKWKEFLFIEDVFLMSLQFSNQESSLEDEKAKRKNTQIIFFTPRIATRCGTRKLHYNNNKSKKLAGRSLLNQMIPSTRQRMTNLVDKVSCRSC